MDNYSSSAIQAALQGKKYSVSSYQPMIQGRQDDIR